MTFSIRGLHSSARRSPVRDQIPIDSVLLNWLTLKARLGNST